jgi:Flavin containing amine oxidoreductase
MAEPTPATPQSKIPAPDGPRVAVVGGGLAGLAAALRLAQRGFAVTVYESQHTLGGNFSANEVNGVFHDVYPHMFCPWYANFWQVFGEIHDMDPDKARTQEFDARDGVKFQDKGATDYLELENGTTLKSVFANLNSKVESWPDMFLLGFSMLDLAATPFQRTGDDLLERLDVNGFIYSRGYSTEKVAALQNYILMVIWSIQSNVTAAASYQDFIKHSMAFPHAAPFCWLLRGSLYERIIRPFEDKLWKLGCGICLGHTAKAVELGPDGRPLLTFEITRQDAEKGAASVGQVSPDYVVMAVPGPELARLAMSGNVGTRLVDKVPEFSELRRFRGEAIPVVDIYFKKKLAGVPKEQVALKQSDSDLTMLDISQLWTGYPDLKDRTALVVAASNGYALTSDVPEIQGFQIIQKLHDDYLPGFNPGKQWGDPDSDIDWGRTLFRSNDGNRLFVNDVGSWQWRPVAAYPALERVFIAGDFCQTDVDMATVEAAIQSGVAAAQAVQAKDKPANGVPRGEPIVPARHEVYGDTVFLAIKLALLPFAYACTAWAAVVDEQPLIGRSASPAAKRAPTMKAAPQNSYSPLTYSLLLPVAFTLDWWKTAYWLGRKLLPDPQAPVSDDVTIGLVGYAEGMAKAAVDYLNSPPIDAAGAKTKLGKAISGFAHQLGRTAQVGIAAGAELYDPANYRRFWRKKG